MRKGAVPTISHTISPSRLLTISPSQHLTHHLTISPSRHLTFSPSQHLTHHLTISPSRLLTISHTISHTISRSHAHLRCCDRTANRQTLAVGLADGLPACFQLRHAWYSMHAWYPTEAFSSTFSFITSLDHLSRISQALCHPTHAVCWALLRAHSNHP